MRFGRIVKIELLESYVIDKHMPKVSLRDFDPDEEISDSTEQAPELEEHWAIIEEEETSRKFKATSYWREFVTDEIKTNEDLGEFPFNITGWEHKFDIDVDINLEQSVPQGRNIEDLDFDDRSYDSNDVLEAEVTIYNPPKELVKEMGKIRMYKKEGLKDKELDISDQPFRKMMRIKAGYYGKHGMNVPIIFQGQINPEQGVEYTEEGGESEIIFNVETSVELYDEPLDKETYKERYGEQAPIVNEELFEYDTKLDDAIKRIIKGRGLTLGRVVTQYEDPDKEEPQDIIIPGKYGTEASGKYVKRPLLIEAGTPINQAIAEVIEFVNEKHKPNLDKELTVESSMDGVVDIVPTEYRYFKGIELRPEIGLISINRQSSGGEGIVLEDEDEDEQGDEYELQTLFIPEVAHGEIIKVKEREEDDWEFYEVNDYSHEIPHNSSATTTLVCSKLEDVNLLGEDEEQYSIEAVNPYAEADFGVR